MDDGKLKDGARPLIDEALTVLRDFEVGEEQLNDRSAMTLLALLHLKVGDEWSQATNPLMGTRAIMDWIRNEFDVDYKPNTRETIRRFTLHQFVMAGIVEENADDPGRPINSPKWNYRVTADALAVMRQYEPIPDESGGSVFENALAGFLAGNTSYRSLAQERRNLPRVPVILPSGKTVNLSQGGQSVLIAAIVEDMLPRFAPGCRVLYLDDTDHQLGAIDGDALARLGIALQTRDKAPDVIAWDSSREWLFLMEAASTHGPIDVTRKNELHRIFAAQWSSVVLVSCFPNRKVMQRYLSELAWETEAWCADNPDHLIHFDGSRFLGPYGET